MKKIIVTTVAVLSFWASSALTKSAKLNNADKKEIQAKAKEVAAACVDDVRSQVYDSYLSIERSNPLKVTGNDFELEVTFAGSEIEKIKISGIEDSETVRTVIFEKDQPLFVGGDLEPDQAVTYAEKMLSSIHSTIKYYFEAQKVAVK